MEGARRRPCREGEGAGLGEKSITGRERKLLLRGIGEGITEDDESRRPAELLVAAAMEMGANGARVWGREAGRARELEERGSGRPVRIRTGRHERRRRPGKRWNTPRRPARGVDEAVHGRGMGATRRAVDEDGRR